MLDDVHLAWAARMSAAGVRFRISCPDQVVRLDRDRVRQALDNLVDNAVRHAGLAGTVDLAALVEGDDVRFVVENSGDSFPTWLLPRVFEPFVTADGDGAAGAGLGLAIVRAVARAHHGDVAAESLVEGGARVVMRLPESRVVGSLVTSS
jgi:signal transduction histidine kinase